MDAPPVPPPTPPSAPAPLSPPRAGRTSHKLLIGCAIGCGGLLVLAIVAVTLVGIGIETGALPDTVAQPRGKIPAAVPAKLVEWSVIEPDEEILYFYSAGLFSIEEDGNLFTDRQVISYEKMEDGLRVMSARYDEIEEVELQRSDSWFEDSVITIHETDGEWFILWVSNESNLDEDFYDKLRRTWESKREAGFPADPAP